MYKTLIKWLILKKKEWLILIKERISDYIYN